VKLPPSLGIALKEWATVCHALETGRQIILLRKGGIYESSGEFELEHPSFLLFPSYLHQKPDQLKPEARPTYAAHAKEPESIAISGGAAVSDIVQLHSRSQMDGLDGEHIWMPPLIDMRFNYRPENPLYLLLARVYRLNDTVTIENTPAYAGCKSWVPLGSEIATAGAVPVLDDAQYAARRKMILDHLG
jgi:hypothetical protein